MPGPRDFKVLEVWPPRHSALKSKPCACLGNQRLTPGGNIKRAKPKPKTSLKKRSQT